MAGMETNAGYQNETPKKKENSKKKRAICHAIQTAITARPSRVLGLNDNSETPSSEHVQQRLISFHYTSKHNEKEKRNGPALAGILHSLTAEWT